MAERIVTGAYVRVWLATFAAFVAFGMPCSPSRSTPATSWSRATRDRRRDRGRRASSELLSLVGGRIADRRGRRVVLVAGAFVMVSLGTLRCCSSRRSRR